MKHFFTSKKYRIIISVISLVLIVSLLTIATYSWLETQTVNDVSPDSISLNVDPGLNASWGDNSKGAIEIDNFELREVSSLDGRNVYVPDDSFNSDDATTSGGTNVTTDELRFREAVAGDVYDGISSRYGGTRYVSFDINISSASGTDVFMSNESIISGLGKNFIRVSVNANDGTEPVVFSNRANVGMNVMCDAVSNINNTSGKATTQTQTAYAFSEYSFGNTPVFNLNAGELKTITITIWLEGSSNIGSIGNNANHYAFDDGDFPDGISEDDVNVHLKFSTEKDYTNEINIIDRTLDTWLGDGENAVFVFDASTYDPNKTCVENDYWQLTPSQTNEDYWTVNLPQNVTSIIIQRFNLSEASQPGAAAVYNAWGWTDHAIVIPGAQALRDSGNEQQRKDGISRTYNILGNYYYDKSELNAYEAGIWGEFSDSSFDKVYLFDQYSASITDGTGYFSSHSFDPYVNMTVSYSYGGESITTKLRYTMYANYVGNRLFRCSMYVGGQSGYTVTNDQFIPIARGYRSGTATYSSAAGSSIDFANIGANRYYGYRYTNTTGYWGKSLVYYNNQPDRDGNISGVRYATYFFNNSGGYEWHNLVKWSDTYSVTGKTINHYACVVPSSYFSGSVIFCRMNGSNTTNSWDNVYNQSANCFLIGYNKYTHQGYNNKELTGTWTYDSLLP